VRRLRRETNIGGFTHISYFHKRICDIPTNSWHPWQVRENDVVNKDQS
jgi:hypothetical protein